MYYYFSSSYPAVLKLNGIYYGSIFDSVKTCNVQDGNLPFIEICPLGGKEEPTAIIPDAEFLSVPPEQISVTDLGGGYLLKFESSYKSQEFKVFAQQKYSDAVVTAFSENGYKLSIETKSDFYAESLRLNLNSVEIVRSQRYKELVAVYLYAQKTIINIYNINGSIKKLFSREVETADLKDSLITVENLSDMAKHKVNVEWQYQDGKFTVKNKKVEESSGFDKDRLTDRIKPYAFLEALLAGGDYEYYLGDGIKQNADKLGGFLGEFIGVMPPPVFRDIEEVGVVYSNGKNLYSVKYYKFEIKEGKIVNITC